MLAIHKGFLPFLHAVELERAFFAGSFADAIPHLWWVLGYMVITVAVAISVFLRQMRANK